MQREGVVAVAIGGLIGTDVACGSAAHLLTDGRAGIALDPVAGSQCCVALFVGRRQRLEFAVAGSITTAKLADDAVTYAKIQNVSATSRILLRKTSGAGDVEEGTLSELLDFVGSAVSAIDAPANRLTLQNGTTLDYDYLVITTGPKLSFSEVPGAGPLSHGGGGKSSGVGAESVASAGPGEGTGARENNSA